METETSYYKCKLCGYIHRGRKIPSVCRVCGAIDSPFTPYELNIKKNRENILRLDLHPIAAHFGVGGTIFLTIIFFISLAKPVIFGYNIGYGGLLDFFVVLQPFFVLFTLLFGILDGKMRFKKLKTEYLELKIILATAMMISSILIVVFHFNSNSGADVISVILESIMIVITIAFAGILGIIGSKLKCNIVSDDENIPIKKDSIKNE